MFTDIESLVDILGEDPAGQAVLGHVGSLHHTFHVASIELAHYLANINRSQILNLTKLKTTRYYPEVISTLFGNL